ncbi:hypothetical protein [Sodalis glossinidius]|uniref:hypothetical protein n=1 Tax=Sodalis glossinidius TaxID=63612 RepID=UPI0002E09742|nr:hypothetical protein [Sodalis glossinidius]
MRGAIGKHALAGLGAGGVPAMLNGLLAPGGPRAAAEKRWGLVPCADPCRLLLYTAAFLAPGCGWLPIGDYRAFIILVAAVLLFLLWNLYRLGVPEAANATGEGYHAVHNLALPPSDGKGLDRRFLKLWSRPAAHGPAERCCMLSYRLSTPISSVMTASISGFPGTPSTWPRSPCWRERGFTDGQAAAP